MLLTLAATSFRSLLKKERPVRAGGGGGGGGGGDGKSLRLVDLPRFAREELGLFGLNISTEFLVGADLARLDQVRDSADKASCPYLVLIESEVQPYGHHDDDKGQAAIDRMVKVARAANRLGCSSVATAISVPEDGSTLDIAAARLKRTLQAADRLEINLLISPSKGLTANPEKLTELIKKVGGFRIGTFPDFQAAAATEDPIHYLRKLTPYAAAVSASVMNFKASKKPPGFVHEPYDLTALAKAVAAVGYTGTLAIDYRGDGDPAEDIPKARTMLEAAIGVEAPVELDDDE